MYQLADALLVSRSGATRLIDRLEERGWVARRVAPHDRRVVRAELTREGAAAFARMGTVFAAAFDERFGGLLDDADVAELRRVLAKLLAAALTATTVRGAMTRRWRSRSTAGRTWRRCWRATSAPRGPSSRPRSTRGWRSPTSTSAILQPALYEIGRWWAVGDFSVADEHSATAVTQSVLGMLGPRMRTAPKDGRLAMVTRQPGGAPRARGPDGGRLPRGRRLGGAQPRRLDAGARPRRDGRRRAARRRRPLDRDPRRPAGRGRGGARRCSRSSRDRSWCSAASCGRAPPATMRRAWAPTSWSTDPRELVALLRERFPPQPPDAGGARVLASRRCAAPCCSPPPCSSSWPSPRSSRARTGCCPATCPRSRRRPTSATTARRRRCPTRSPTTTTAGGVRAPRRGRLGAPALRPLAGRRGGDGAAGRALAPPDRGGRGRGRRAARPARGARVPRERRPRGRDGR